MRWLYTKLKYFDQEDAQFLVYTLTKDKVDALTTDQKQSVEFLFSRINGQTTENSLNAIIDCVSQAFIYDESLSVYRVNEGEDFDLIIKKDNVEDSYSSYILVAREHLTNKILAEKTASDSETQPLSFTNLDLEAGQTYKIRIQLEEDAGSGSTDGDAVSELTTAFFVVINNIDSE